MLETLLIYENVDARKNIDNVVDIFVWILLKTISGVEIKK